MSSDLPQVGIGEDEDPTRVYALTKYNLERIVIDIIRNTIGTFPAFQHQLLPAVRKELGLALNRILHPSNRELVMDSVQHSTNLELKFLNKLKRSQPVLTGRNIEGEDGSACLKIALFEVGTGKFINFGPEASATVKIVVIPEHPDSAEPVLPACKSFIAGTRCINLKEGIGLLDGIYIPHKKNWRKKGCQLMLGANVVDNFDRVTIKGAKSELFILRDSRAPLYAKHHPPSLSDKVWRLKNISKGGTLQERLSSNNIETVEDFLKIYHINPQQLREILGSGMSSKKLNDTVRHGLECRLEERFLYQLPGYQQKPCGVIFNRVGQVLGLQDENCNILYVDKMSETEKNTAQNLVVSAFADWEKVIPYDVHKAICPSSVFDRARQGTFSQGINSSDHLMLRSPASVFGHAQPSTSSHGINSSVGWTPKGPVVPNHAPPSTSSQGITSSASCPTAVFDNSLLITSSQGITSSASCPTAVFDNSQLITSSQGITSSASCPTAVFDTAQLVTSSQGINSSVEVPNDVTSATMCAYDSFGDPEGIQENYLGDFINSPTFARDSLRVSGKPDYAYEKYEASNFDEEAVTRLVQTHALYRR